MGATDARNARGTRVSSFRGNAVVLVLSSPKYTTTSAARASSPLTSSPALLVLGRRHAFQSLTRSASRPRSGTDVARACFCDLCAAFPTSLRSNLLWRSSAAIAACSRASAFSRLSGREQGGMCFFAKFDHVCWDDTSTSAMTWLGTRRHLRNKTHWLGTVTHWLGGR